MNLLRLLPRPAGLEGRAPEARVTRVIAPPDERLLRIDLQEGGRFRGGTRALVLELHTNQGNALLVATTATVAAAQDTGVVAGTVVDSTAQVVPGATVTLANENTGDVRTLPSNERGDQRSVKIGSML